jgi:hypothetical protein
MPITVPFISEVPESVAILGMGRSIATYVLMIGAAGNARSVHDQVWAINAAAASLRSDLIFHMDDIAIQERRAAGGANPHIAGLLATISGDGGPLVVTSRFHQRYPRARVYPLQEVLREVHYAYFNSTAAYALALAVAIGVKRVGLYGCDFSYPDAHRAEKGRGCLEFWIGMAMARGIVIQVPGDSTLMDSCVPERERMYGYDAVDVSIAQSPEGPVVSMTMRDEKDIPSAEEIERRYRGVVSSAGGR